MRPAAPLQCLAIEPESMTSSPSLFAGRIVLALTEAAAFVISRFRTLQTHRLTDDECETAGLPYGSTDPAVHVFRLAGRPWWRMDLWSDGEGCLHVVAFGWTGEVYWHQSEKQDAA